MACRVQAGGQRIDQRRADHHRLGDLHRLRSLVRRADAEADRHRQSVAARTRGIAVARCSRVAERVPVIPAMLT